MSVTEEARGPITAKEMDDWACGQATPEVKAAVEAALQDPGSQPSRYCDWLRNPAKYVREHGREPDFVLEQLESISPETRQALLGINDGLFGATGHVKAVGRGNRSSRKPHAAPSGNDYGPEENHEQGPERFLGPDKSPGSSDRSP